MFFLSKSWIARMLPGAMQPLTGLLFVILVMIVNQHITAQGISEDGYSLNPGSKTKSRDSQAPDHDAATKQFKPFTVMTYNIQQLGYENWMANHFEKERLALIPETLLSLEEKPDILIFQEVFTEYSFDFLVQELSHDFPYHTEVVAQDCTRILWMSVQGDCRVNSFKGNGGVSIFSRWPITAKHAYVYRAVRISSTFDFMAQKGVVYARILIGDQQVHVLGTHLQADSASHDIRMRQLEEMRSWFDSFDVPKSEAVILGGDFNVSSNDTDKLAELLSVSVSKFELLDQNFGSISPGTNQYLNLISSRNSEKTLDFILYRTDHLQPVNRPQLKVLNFKSGRSWTGIRLFREDVEMNDLSDHYPTITVFQY